jgi:acetyl esterase/lipase
MRCIRSGFAPASDSHRLTPVNIMDRILLPLILLLCLPMGFGAERVDVWPSLAPGETTQNTGELLPFRPTEKPPVTRVVKVTRPTFTVHLAKDPNGSAAVILPGGGFGKVVPDKEGTEAADWLNKLGVSAFVVSYRTTEDKSVAGWIEPLQDAQRTLSLVRSAAERWGLKEDRIGLVGFSAGGQVAARLLSDPANRSYERIDEVDDVPYRPDFAVLVYPWNIYDADRDSLAEGIMVTKNCPPAYIVHTDDDRSSSVGAALYYAGLRKRGIPAELHIYGNGGHGYGLRPVHGSQISSWPDHAAHWLGTQRLLDH